MNLTPETAAQTIELGVQIVGVASIVASMTPSPKDDGILAIIRKILDLLAFNVGHSKRPPPQ